MIRAGMPLPPAIRLRLKADAAAEGLALRLQRVRKQFVGVIRNDIAALRGTPQRFTRTKDHQHPEVMSTMQEFVSRYDALVDLLCWTAKEGVNDARRARYSELRSWFVQNYDGVRPAVTRFMDILPEDAEPIGEGARPPRDAFEALFLPYQIDALIHSEAVIYRIMRTRNAVEACREELERVCVLAG